LKTSKLQKEKIVQECSGCLSVVKTNTVGDHWVVSQRVVVQDERPGEQGGAFGDPKNGFDSPD
jgi:hypothetical protein